MVSTKLGIVVIGRNEAEHLRACLGSLQAYSKNIVYADSASSDASVEIASGMCARVVCIDPSKPLTPARGRNEGFEAVLRIDPKCEFVQFVDGDSVVEPGWIEAGLSFLQEHPLTAVVCGHVLEAHPQQSVYNWLCADEWKGAIGRVNSCGGNAMMRVTALQDVGLFRDDLIAGEEAELMARMRSRGWEIWRLDIPMVTHDANLGRFGEWWRRNRRGGYAAANVWWLTRRTDEPLYGAQLRSPVLWVVAWPLMVLLFALLFQSLQLLLLVPLGWLVQIIRTAAKRGIATGDAWRYAGMIMVARVPEAVGVLRFIGQKAFR